MTREERRAWAETKIATFHKQLKEAEVTLKASEDLVAQIKFYISSFEREKEAD